METMYEKQGGAYQRQGDYFVPCVAVKEKKELSIGVWANRH